VVQARQVDERQRDPAQLRQPLAVPGAQRAEQRPRQVRHQQRVETGGRRWRRGFLGRRGRCPPQADATSQPLARADVSQQRPRPRRNQHLVGLRLGGRAGRLGHRGAADQQLPAVPHAADVQQDDLAGPQPDAQGQPYPFVGRVVSQRRLHGQRAAGGSPRHRRERPDRVAAGHRPADQQRVAGELQHVTAGRAGQGQQAPEGAVEQPAQRLRASRPALGEALGDGSEAGDVRQQQRARHPVDVRAAGAARVGKQPPHEQIGYTARDRVSGDHGHPAPRDATSPLVAGQRAFRLESKPAVRTRSVTCVPEPQAVEAVAAGESSVPATMPLWPWPSWVDPKAVWSLDKAAASKQGRQVGLSCPVAEAFHRAAAPRP